MIARNMYTRQVFTMSVPHTWLEFSPAVISEWWPHVDFSPKPLKVESVSFGVVDKKRIKRIESIDVE